MLVYPRSKVTPPRHFCSEDQSSVSTLAPRNWSALLLCAPSREVPGLRSGGVVGAQGCAGCLTLQGRRDGGLLECSQTGLALFFFLKLFSHSFLYITRLSPE